MKRLSLTLLLTLFMMLWLPSSLAPAPPDPLEVWYLGYNEVYFNGELPKTVIIDHNLHDDRYMAVTDSSGEYYRITFNLKYDPSPKQGRETLLHEQCHIQLAVEKETELDVHGKKWQSCMHRLANMGAFEDLW